MQLLRAVIIFQKAAESSHDEKNGPIENVYIFFVQIYIREIYENFKKYFGLFSTHSFTNSNIYHTLPHLCTHNTTMHSHTILPSHQS